jgi:hypothetical protein
MTGPETDESRIPPDGDKGTRLACVLHDARPASANDGAVALRHWVGGNVAISANQAKWGNPDTS